MDRKRLCVRFALGETTRCLTPHLGTDVLLALRASFDDVNVTHISDTLLTFTIQQETLIVTRSQGGDESWFTVAHRDKSVFVSPGMTTTILDAAITSAHKKVFVEDILYPLWAQGAFPKSKRRLAEAIRRVHGEKVVRWKKAHITYVDPQSFVDAVSLIRREGKSDVAP